jgi:hypothetical protein
MPSRSRQLYLLALLACWLTLAASGDDFSLTRLVFSDSVPASGALPPDDPNNDFVEAANPRPAYQLVQAARDLGDRAAAPAPNLACAPATGPATAFLDNPAAGRSPSPSLPTAPLRC